jgi:hypothetical protein
LQETGERHPGFDCFIFKRTLLSSFNFGDVFIGAPFFENVWSANFYRYSKNPGFLKDEKVTFHIGSNSEWIVRKNETRDKSQVQSIKMTNRLSHKNALKVIKNISKDAQKDIKALLKKDIISLSRKTNWAFNILMGISMKFIETYKLIKIKFANYIRKLRST